MKQHRRGSGEPRFVDPDFLEALDSNDSSTASARRQIERKTQQFCRQVQRALNLALEGCGADTEGMFVEEVSAAPDCGRLLVEVSLPAGQPVAVAMQALGLLTPRLRSEVAATIARKRSPELFFVPVTVVYDGDE